MNKIENLANIINQSKYIVAFTGAGISCASGIPDFRSATGIYNEKFNNILRPEEIISHSFFIRYPDIFFDFYRSKMIYPDAKPNLAHKYLASLEKEQKLKAVITQNIDGLHQQAGSKNVLELHGTILKNYCLKCHKKYGVDKILSERIPYCDCGGIIRPDVVLYEESLNDDTIFKALGEISKADTLIVIGTSLIVQPAASMINYFHGKNLILINKSHTDYDNKANLVINDDVINVINQLEHVK